MKRFKQYMLENNESFSVKEKEIIDDITKVHTQLDDKELLKYVMKTFSISKPKAITVIKKKFPSFKG